MRVAKLWMFLCLSLCSLALACGEGTAPPGGVDGGITVDALGADGNVAPGDGQLPSDTASLCDPNPCLNSGTCTIAEDGTSQCACPETWEGDLCGDDVDECAADPGPCGADESCTNVEGGFECACGPGTIAGPDGTCEDIDECAADPSPCGENETCTNTDGSFECACAEGYVEDEDGGCTDADECAEDPSPCGENEDCSNIEGGYECACSEGYAADEDGGCQDVDECLEDEGPCQENAICTNTDGSYDCECADGFDEQEDGSCSDVDECEDPSPCGENATCSNAEGSYDCTCDDGYEGDGLECSDIDECADEVMAFEDFSAPGEDGAPEGWTLVGTDLLDPEKEDPVSWHINAAGQLQYSNAAGSDYNGTSSGVAAMPAMAFEAGYTLKASVSLELGDQLDPSYDQASLGILSCTGDQDFFTCLQALNNEDVDEDGAAVAAFALLWSKADYAAEPGELQDIAVDLSAAAGTSGWLSFVFDSVDDLANDGSGFIIDHVAITLGVDPCGPNETCTNVAGSFECACSDGYEADAEGACADVDECLSPDACGANEDCTNTDGSFECGCSEGFTADANGDCLDVDECAEANDCDVNATCNNVPGGYECVCNDGYGGDGTSCANIDECADGVDMCGANTSCVDSEPSTLCQGEDDCSDQACRDAVGQFDGWCLNNWDGLCASCAAGGVGGFGVDCGGIGAECTGAGYACECNQGYGPDDGGFSCSDLDECGENNGGCAQVCTNSDGAYACSCNDGYSLEEDGFSCLDVDECAIDNGGCEQICTNSDGGYECSCDDGYALDEAALGCTDIDECAVDDGGCEYGCINTEGSFVCGCADGFVLDENNSCVNVDECADGLVECGVNEECLDKTLKSVCQSQEGCEDDECRAAVGELDGFCLDDWDNFCASCAAGELGFGDLDCSSIAQSEVCVSPAYSCDCVAGFAADAEGACVNLDECTVGVAMCSDNAICVDAEPGPLCQGDSCNDAACTEAVGLYDDWCLDNWDFLCASCAAGGLGFGNIDCSGIGDGCDGPFYTCLCPDGWVLEADGVTCADVDECAAEPVPCDVNATCANEPGSYGCACNAGYEGDGVSCADIDECAVDDGGCEYSCINTEGSFVCVCPDGFVPDENNSCVNVDECADGLAECGINEECLDKTPKSVCQSEEGCEDDECLAAVGELDDFCLDDWDGFCASCAAGEFGFGDLDCSSIAESEVCVSPAYSCDCVAGFAADAEGACVNVDECADGLAECGINEECLDKTPKSVCQSEEGCEDDECLAAVGELDVFCLDDWDSFCASCAAGKLGFGDLDCSSIAESEVCVSPAYSCNFEGEVGPDFSGDGWLQCEGYHDTKADDEIPQEWGDDCASADYGKIRLACGNMEAYRYIDVNKNVFKDGLADYPEKGLIVGANFEGYADEIFADGNHPHVDVSWWGGGAGCDESSANITINNNVCEWEAANCFGQNMDGPRYLWVYVQP